MPGVLESAPSGVDRLEKEKVASLARDVARAAELFASGDQGLEVAARMQTAAAAQALLDAVRPAPEVVLTWFQSGAVISAVRIFQDWNMFDTIPEHGSMTYSELAVKGKAEETLLGQHTCKSDHDLTADQQKKVRIAAMLTSTGVLKATGLDRVAHTPISLVLREDEPMGSMFKVMLVASSHVNHVKALTGQVRQRHRRCHDPAVLFLHLRSSGAVWAHPHAPGISRGRARRAVL